MSNTIIKKVNEALEEIRPFLISDGGNVELIEVKDHIVKVKLTGACLDCSINQSTLKLGIEATIKKHVPEITEVINVSV